MVLGLNSPRETRNHSIGDWPSSLDRSQPSRKCGTSVTNKQVLKNIRKKMTGKIFEKIRFLARLLNREKIRIFLIFFNSKLTNMHCTTNYIGMNISPFSNSLWLVHLLHDFVSYIVGNICLCDYGHPKEWVIWIQ